MDRYTCPDGTPHCAHYDDGGTCCKCNDDATALVEWYTTDEVANRAGLTFRQVDYWIRRGAIVPSLRSAHGSGTRRRWSPLDLARLRAIADVTAALGRLGVSKGFDVELIEELWADLVDTGSAEWHDGPVRVVVSVDDYLPSVT
jgi:hypothetical protein